MQLMPTHVALVVPTPGQILIESVPTKRPRAGEILVSPLRVGICGSDLDMMRGTQPVGTRILGHEGWQKSWQSALEPPPFPLVSMSL